MSTSKINLQYTTFTTPLPDFIYQGLKEYSRDANTYRSQPIALIEKLAAKYLLPKELIYLTAGADEAIAMFALAFGQKTYFFTPTYIEYPRTADFYANVQAISALKNDNYEISTALISDATLFYIANPNNPFGFTEKEKLIELIENNPQAIVVVDEVYAEFADLSVIDLVQKYANLAVLRSFSKAYGMAGNRIGWVAAQPPVIAKILPKAQWASVSYLSVGAAVTALDHEDYFIKLRQEILVRREDLMRFLQGEKFHILPSKINAVLLHFSSEKAGTEFADYLATNNFVVSHGNGASNAGLDLSFIRISIGTDEETKLLKETIKNYPPTYSRS